MLSITKLKVKCKHDLIANKSKMTCVALYSCMYIKLYQAFMLAFNGSLGSHLLTVTSQQELHTIQGHIKFKDIMHLRIMTVSTCALIYSKYTFRQIS